MSPQVASFNRGIWKKLETQVRNWAIEYDSLYVVTGPIFSDSMKIIGPHRVAVPNAYYKVILDQKNILAPKTEDLFPRAFGIF